MDIESPKSIEEKQLDAEIAALLSEANDIVVKKRAMLKN